MGININQNELTLYKTKRTVDDFVDMYYVRKNIDIDKIVLQATEVDDVVWADRKKIQKLISNGDFSSSHIEFYKSCLKFLNKK